ncbi:MAG TPA: ABC transporter ATP-binding protein [Flavobacteriales bacterium]|nr:ABC transporter ATP-binding protein [Flavobacteriales bacterium]MBK6550955.1 ABC transporter ATP-binding protein [Flavobacteriales bacterium]MBK7101273.1 ABC transporter ATP-binding protein [Flavobacteriales bacterium]MBK7618992.1 ABC transporter ATP-binding protein [Flavobacteriales bacterium]MBK8707653.1 ABC transporter ATP-binding protein [Flavobacteriales bacterium]
MIELHDVHVDYMVQRHGFSSIKSYLTSFGTKRLLERKRILHGVDLRIDSGECFGIVGRNGSGKSTLLRLLAGIVEPSKGVANIRGRVAPMLALGVGLEPELSGWENVRLCRLLMGHEHRDRDAIRRYVSTFSGLSDEDLAMQVKRYSTGMMARLGFAIATATDPEILLIDEVLAVGDVAFQQQCYRRIEALKAKGCTIVFVSHMLGEVQRICDRAACVEAGTIVKVGTTHEVGMYYHELLGIPT